jgi:peptidoglycan/LPS O-acetylase OafA/YrhL
MIQRIQTIWLLLAAVAMALTFKFKFAAGFLLSNGQNLPKDVMSTNHFLASIFAIAFIVASIISIFLFKNRKLQMKIVGVSILTGLITIYFLYNKTTTLSNITYSIGAVLPFFSVGFVISALRCIWQDQKKIKDLNSNRLR